jgi:Ca2+-binding RTX toxin-like protein
LPGVVETVLPPPPSMDFWVEYEYPTPPVDAILRVRDVVTGVTDSFVFKWFGGFVGSLNLAGGNRDSAIVGGSGNDTIRGGSGDDNLIGGGGDDYLSSASGADILEGGAGNDTIRGGGASTIDGGDGDDVITGGGVASWIGGGAGNDTIRGGGASTIDGGDGDDVITGGGVASWIGGGAGNDTIRGGNGGATLDGGSGRDIGVGGDGDDIIVGGGGDDRLTGGAGNDTFWFSTIADGIDRITDFVPGADMIGLEFLAPGTVFVSGGAPVAGEGATVLYNTTNGRLSVDLDGAGGAPAVLLAILLGAPALQATDLIFGA